jgi:hypothetical protein
LVCSWCWLRILCIIGMQVGSKIGKCHVLCAGTYPTLCSWVFRKINAVGSISSQEAASTSTLCYRVLDMPFHRSFVARDPTAEVLNISSTLHATL